MHTFEMKKKVHKKEGCGTYCENKCEKGNVDPIHTCTPTFFYNRWSLDCKCPFIEYLDCTCEWALGGNLCKHQNFIILMVINVTKRMSFIIMGHGLDLITKVL